jgi:hypothetical protein
MRAGVTLFGRTTAPRWTVHESTACAGVSPAAAAAFLTAGAPSISPTSLPEPSGEYASRSSPFSFANATSSGCGLKKESSTWFTAGRILRSFAVRFFRRAMLKLVGHAVSVGVHGAAGHGLADTDVADLALCDHLLHLAPRRERVRGEGLVDDRLAVLRHIFSEGNWPMHKIEVEVVDAEVAEGLVERALDRVGRVERVPELARQPHVAARDAGRRERGADLGLVPVRPRAVDVPVAGLERGLDGLADLVRLCEPDAERDLRGRSGCVSVTATAHAARWARTAGMRSPLGSW